MRRHMLSFAQRKERGKDIEQERGHREGRKCDIFPSHFGHKCCAEATMALL